MKLTLNLTFEDGMKVVEAMKKVAIEYGWAAEELGESGVIEEYSSAVDAALATMGINVLIDPNPSYEDENKYCDSAADCSFCNSDEEEQDEDDDEEDDGNTTTVKDDFVRWYMEEGYSFEEACRVADILFGEGE